MSYFFGYVPAQSDLEKSERFIAGTRLGLNESWLDHHRKQYNAGQGNASQSQFSSPYFDNFQEYTQTPQGFQIAEFAISPDATISGFTQPSEHGRVPDQQVSGHRGQPLAPLYHTGSQQSFPSQPSLTTHAAVDDLDYKLQCVGQMKEWTKQLTTAVRLDNDTETTLPLGLETYIRPISTQVHGARKKMLNPDQASLGAWDQRTQQTCERVVEGYQKWIDTGSWPVDLDLQDPS